MGEQTWAARFAMPLALVALLAGCCRGALAAESPRYVAVPLGSLGGGSSHATAINARGDVTGLSRTAGGEVHAFVLLNGVMRDLGTLGGPRSEAYSISAIGWTTGASYASASESYAFISDGTTMASLAAAGQGATGYGINASGHVTGRMLVAGEWRAFLYAGGTLTNLGGFGEASSYGWAINTRGEVLVTAETFPGPTHTYVVRGGAVTSLGTLGGASTFGVAINEHGNVTGSSETATGQSHAFLYTGTGLTDLGTLGNDSHGMGINGARDIVGRSHISGVGSRAMLAQGGRMYDLNTLVIRGLLGSDVLAFASGINDGGQIVANTCDTTITPVQTCSAYRLDPLPPVAEVPVLGLGALILLALTLAVAAGGRLLGRSAAARR